MNKFALALLLAVTSVCTVRADVNWADVDVELSIALGLESAAQDRFTEADCDYEEQLERLRDIKDNIDNWPAPYNTSQTGLQLRANCSNKIADIVLDKNPTFYDYDPKFANTQGDLGTAQGLYATLTGDPKDAYDICIACKAIYQAMIDRFDANAYRIAAREVEVNALQASFDYYDNLYNP